MPFSFPSSPSIGDKSTQNSREYEWSGYAWEIVATPAALPASVITSGTFATARIADDAVTYAKIQNVSATDRLLGRSSAGAGDVEEITCTSFGRSLIDDADAAAARTTLGLGTLATQSGTFSGTSSGTNTGDQTITLTGDVTGSGTGSFAATLANTAVTAGSYGSASAVGTFTVDAKGRLTAASNTTIAIAASAVTSGTLDPNRLPFAGTIFRGAVIVSTGLTIDANGYLTVDFGSGGDQVKRGNSTSDPTDNSVSTQKIQNDAVTYAKIQNVSATDRLLGRSSAGSGDVEEISCTAAGRALLSGADAAAQRTTLSVQPTASPAFTGAATFDNTGNVVPLTVTNTGTANSFVVNDASGDTTPFVIDASGNVGIGTSSPAAALDVGSGNLRFSSTAQRITGDFSNSTISNRLMFQTSTSNGNTSVRCIPNGTATVSNFVAHNGSDSNNTSFIALQASLTETIVNSGSTGTGTYLPLTFYTNNVPQVQISTSGQLLVTAGSASACGVAFGGDPDTGIAQLSAAGANTLSICTGGSERVRVGSGGGVGIGTATTTDALNVVGITSHYQSSNGTPALGSKTYYSACFENFSAGYGLAVGGVQGGNGAAYLQVQSFSSAVAYPMYLQALGGEVLVGGTTDQGAYNLQCNGTAVWGAGAYVNGSDERIKEDITPLGEATSVIAAIQPVTFRYKPTWSSDQSVQPGFIAQQLQQALAGTAYGAGIVQQGTEYLSVAYQSLIPLLVKALQESNARIAALEERLNHA